MKIHVLRIKIRYRKQRIQRNKFHCPLLTTRCLSTHEQLVPLKRMYKIRILVHTPTQLKFHTIHKNHIEHTRPYFDFLSFEY